MKRFVMFAIALAFAGSAGAHQTEPRKIRIECSPSITPMMIDVRRAVARSDYGASLSARREILIRARDTCAATPGAVLTFVPLDAQQGNAIASGNLEGNPWK